MFTYTRVVKFLRYLMPLFILGYGYFAWSQGLFDELLASMNKMGGKDWLSLSFKLISGFITSGFVWLGFLIFAGEWLVKFKLVKEILDLPAMILGYQHENDIEERQKFSSMFKNSEMKITNEGGAYRCDKTVKFDRLIPPDYIRYFVSYSHQNGHGSMVWAYKIEVKLIYP